MSSGNAWQRAVWWGVLLAVGALAAFLRFETIDFRPIWYDEIYTTWFTRDAKGLGEVWRSNAVDASEHPPLFYIVSYLSVQIRNTLAFMRLPSALSGIASVLLVMALGRVVFDRRVGIVAGLGMALSVYHINYSLDARPYMLLLALSAGQYLAFYALITRRTLLPLLAFVLCGAGSIYTHHTALAHQGTLGLLTLALLAAGFRKRRLDAAEGRAMLRAGVRILAGFVAILLLYLPQLPYLLQFWGVRYEPKHSLDLSPGFLHHLVERWGGGVGWVPFVYEVAFAAGLLWIARRRDWSLGIVAWFATPLLLFALVPFEKFFDVRFVMTGLPAFYLITAAGIVALGEAVAVALRPLGRSAAPWVAAAVILALTGTLAARSAQAYATFRLTKSRCSNFFWDPRVLEQGNDFCRKHILLNSFLDPSLLRPRGGR